MDAEMMRFLTALSRGFVGPVTSRVQDRARQKCRRKGLAVFDRPTWAWAITDAGRAVIAAPVKE